jgi:hypothetical protein
VPRASPGPPISSISRRSRPCAGSPTRVMRWSSGDDTACQGRALAARQAGDPVTLGSRSHYRRSRGCATAARPAARSPTTTPRRIIRRRSSGDRADESAGGLPPTISSPACSRRHSTAPRSSPRSGCRNRRRRAIIVGVFVARTPGGVRIAVTGAEPCVFRVPEMEAALARSLAERDQEHHDPAGRPQLGHPRQRRIPRPSRRRDGPPRRRRLWIGRRLSSPRYSCETTCAPRRLNAHGQVSADVGKITNGTKEPDGL